VVTGAVYGLMSGGNNAFRREPELTDRQQNARVAMDLIQTDIGTAGVNMGPFFQSFSVGLDGAGRITGPSGQVADHLEIFGSDGTCPDAPAAKPPNSGVNFNAIGHIPGCYSEDSIVLVIYSNGGAKWGVGHNIHTDATKINFPPGQGTVGSQLDSKADLDSYMLNDKAACAAIGKPEFCSGVPERLAAVNILRYEIAPDLVDGVPSLYRSATGGRDPADSGAYLEPINATNITNGNWQLIARGIEDLQVQYRNGNGAWANEPGDVNCGLNCVTPSEAEYNKGIREVRVTISARAEGQNLQGQSSSAAAGAGSRANAVRGTVTTVTSVKALQNFLSVVGPTVACPTCPVWR
jgi:hypothetical protein